MKNILELFYDQHSTMYDENSEFVREARIKMENYDMLQDSMTNEQKILLDDYFEADSRIEEIGQFNKFRYAFHLGAHIMAEIINGKDDVLE